MDLKRVARIEQSVHTLLADPTASRLTKSQQKEWKAIDVALEHLIQKMKTDDQGRRSKPAPSPSSFSASPTAAAALPQQSQRPAPPSSTATGAPLPSSTEARTSSTDGTASAREIHGELLSSADGSLGSMLLELEMALKAAERERNAGHGAKL